MLSSGIGKSLEHTEGRSTAFFEPLERSVGSQNERRFVSGVAVFQATARDVEYARKDG